MRRETVLVADDEPAIRQLVRAAIESDEYRVVEAVDGDQAWAVLSEQRPAVAILDVRMPGGTGWSSPGRSTPTRTCGAPG